MSEPLDFLENHKESLHTLGFWTEMYKTTVMATIEAIYKPEIRQNYQITDIVINCDNVLVKWQKRMFIGDGGAER
jgi:hypothetical protein